MSAAGYHRPRDVGVVEGEPGESGAADAVYVAHLPDGPLQVLEGTGALIWRAATTASASGGHPEDAVTEQVARQVGVEPDEIRSDVESFLSALLERGLLELG